jgi:uncharacterized iron-regulated membrane protein
MGWLSPRLVGAVLSGHSALGLAVSVLIYLISLSGTIVVFAQELERWEQPSGPVVTAIEPGAIDRGLMEIRSRAPSASAISITLPTGAVPRLTLIEGTAEDGANAWLADARGRVVAKVNHPATDFLVKLHTALHLPRIAGLAVVGLIGVALLALLISGVLAHPRIFREAFTLRWGGSRRLQEADLHNRLGTWGLPFHIMITLTGAVLGIFLLMFGGMAATAYKGDFRHALLDIIGPLDGEGATTPTSIPPIDPILMFVRARAPSATVQSLEIQDPGTRKQRLSVIVDEAGELSQGSRYVFDANGRLTFSSTAAHPSIGRQALLALQPLHFGWFGGLATKLAYGLLGLSLCVMTSSGVKIWLARRRDRGRPGEVWERIWIATNWGQPSAILLAAIVSLVWTDENAVGVGWGIGTAIAYIIACIPLGCAELAFAFRTATASLLALLGALHALHWYGHSCDEVVWVVDAALEVAAVAIAVTSKRRPRMTLRTAADTSAAKTP